MATNKYFNNSFVGNINEQNLLNDLTIEVIQAHGIDVMYMPRKLISEDKLFGEDASSEFKKAIEIEMYLETPLDYGGEGELMSKFQIEVRKELTFTVSSKRVDEVLGIQRPLEGDLIYIPMFNMMFEITFVEDEPTLYQLGSQYTYKIFTKTFEFSHEKIETNFEDIDEIHNQFFNDGTDSNGLATDTQSQNTILKQEGDAVTDTSEDSIFGGF